MLLVYDGEREIVKNDVVLKERVGTDDDLRRATFKPIANILTRPAFLASCEQSHRDAGWCRELLGGRQMLSAKDLGRRHQSSLPAAFDGVEHRQQSDDGFAGADIALKQTHHTSGRCHVGIYLGERLKLCGGEPKRQRADYRLAQPAIAG